MKALYESVTGEQAHQRAIDGQLRKLPENKQRILRARAAGASLKQIAAAEGITHATVASYVTRACEQIRKRIAHKPRYSVSRKGMGGRPKG